MPDFGDVPAPLRGCLRLIHRIATPSPVRRGPCPLWYRRSGVGENVVRLAGRWLIPPYCPATQLRPRRRRGRFSEACVQRQVGIPVVGNGALPVGIARRVGRQPDDGCIHHLRLDQVVPVDWRAIWHEFSVGQSPGTRALAVTPAPREASACPHPSRTRLHRA
jgi:hypothetical protein